MVSVKKGNALMNYIPTSNLNICPGCIIVHRKGNLNRFLSSFNTSNYVNINILKQDKTESLIKCYDKVTLDLD